MVPHLTPSGNFDRSGWVAQLAAALTELGRAQQAYQTEVSQQCTFLDFIKMDDTPWRKSEHLSTALRSLYAPGRIPALGDALHQVRRLLTAHPSLKDVLDPSSDHDELWVQDVNLGGTEYLRGIVSGLMARAEEHSRDGYVAAAHELRMLLEAEGDQPAEGCCDPSLGYHVVLFRGLRLDRAFPVEDDVRIVPLDEIGDFVNRQSLCQAMPFALSGEGRELAAAIKPFRWKPQLVKSQADAIVKLPDAHDFLEDAEGLVELLAVLHESPVVCLAKIAVCKNRIASLLLGRFHSIGGFTYGRLGQNFQWRGVSHIVNHEVIERACKTFRNRDSQRYKACAPFIGRLSEALSRDGRFGVTDKILDVAIALEGMYKLDQGEIGYKLRTRAGFFLTCELNERRKVFQYLRKFYEKRSSIIHGRGNENDAQEIFRLGFHIAKRTVDKLLEGGFPDDWDEIIIAGG